MINSSQLTCKGCRYRFDSTTRKPIFLSCDDTICKECAKSLDKCCVCYKVILQEDKQKLRVNKSILNVAEQKKDNIDMMIKVSLVGQSSVGKTCIMGALLGHPFVPLYGPTLGVDFHFCYRQSKGLNIRYQIWDTAGQECFRSVCRSYYKNTNIIIIAYDLKNTPADNKVNEWIQQVLEQCDEQTKIIIAGNKLDLAKQPPINIPLQQTLAKWIEQRYPHIKVSAKTNEGISDLWKLIDENVDYNQVPRTSPTPQKSVKVSELKIKKKGCC